MSVKNSYFRAIRGVQATNWSRIIFKEVDLAEKNENFCAFECLRLNPNCRFFAMNGKKSVALPKVDLSLKCQLSPITRSCLLGYQSWMDRVSSTVQLLGTSWDLFDRKGRPTLLQSL